MVSRTWLSTVSTTSSKAVCVAEGASLSRRVRTAEPPPRTAMMPHVATAASVIGAGPIWHRGTRDEAGQQLVPFARPLADAGEHRDALVFLDHGVDQFHDQNGLAHAGA